MSRADLTQQIRTALTKGFSVHLDGLPGLGLSHYLRELSFPNHPLVYLDGLSENPKLPKVDTFPTTIILDHFDHLLETKESSFFNTLRLLRDEHKYQLTYLIATDHHHNLSAFATKLDHFFELASENHFHFPTANREETAKIAATIAAKLEVPFDPNQIEAIYRFSGGISSLIKTHLLDPHSSRTQGLVNSISDSLADTTNSNLENWGLVSHGEVISSALKQYRKPPTDTPDTPITQTENQLFSHLKTNLNQVVSRDELISVGWPTADPDGVSDQALDQTISRLRRKIDHLSLHLETIKGRGYRLTHV